MLKNRMFKGKKKISQVLLISLLLALGIGNFSHANTLKVCYDQWPPMTIFPSEGFPARGFVIDMLEQIYTSKGYQLEYYEVPLARGLDMVADGLCDMLPEYLFSQDTEVGFEYATEATFAYPTAFVVRQDESWRYDGIQSIQGKRVATGPGWDYSSVSVDYQNYIDDPNNSDLVEVIAGSSDVVERIFQMIKAGRIDLYADNMLVLQYMLNRFDWNNGLKIVRPGLENKLVEIPIFSNKMPAERRKTLINIWNSGRLSIKGDKQKMLLKKYNVAL